MADIIYILINEAMPGFVKVGRTTTSVEQRMRELDNTSMPLPFEFFHAAEVKDAIAVERHIHASIILEVSESALDRVAAQSPEIWRAIASFA